MTESIPTPTARAREGFNAYARGEYERAADLLELALEEPGGDDRLSAYVCLGNAHDALRRNDRALDAFRRALEIDPSSAAAWNNVGLICIRLGRLDEAREALEQAHAHDAESADILVSLGSLALKRADPGNALRALQQALDLQSGHPLAHANMALTLAVFGRLEEAEESLRLASLYGFPDAQPIQDRIDRLKDVRDAVLRDRTRHDMDGADPAEGHDRGFDGRAEEER